MREADRFKEEVGGLSTSLIRFRSGAPFTSQFGLTRRHRDGEWGWPGIHYGVDRGMAPGGDRQILSPFAGQARFEDWRGAVYGSLIFVKHWARFCVAVAHVHPEDVSDNVRRGDVEAGDLLGLVGTYGESTGLHTHTEIRADGDGNQVLDEFLQSKVGGDAFRDMPMEGVVLQYRACERTALLGWDEVEEDYRRLRRDAGILQLSRFRMVRRRPNGGALRTYYSSQLALDF